MPTLILAGTVFALWAIGRHQNRQSSYIIQNIEAYFNVPLKNISGGTQELRKSSWFDNWSGKSRPKPGTVLQGGWETWFEEQDYNYTRWQICVYVAAILLAIGIGCKGYLGSRLDSNGESPCAEDLVAGGSYEAEENRYESIIPQDDWALRTGRPSHEKWYGTLYKDFLVLRNGTSTRVIPAEHVRSLDFREH